MEKLTDLKNLGKNLEKQLIEVGIETPEELRRVGSEDAWGRIRETDPSA